MPNAELPSYSRSTQGVTVYWKTDFIATYKYQNPFLTVETRKLNSCTIPKVTEHLTQDG